MYVLYVVFFLWRSKGSDEIYFLKEEISLRGIVVC